MSVLSPSVSSRALAWSRNNVEAHRLVESRDRGFPRMTRHLYVATNGLSVWSSSDLGETISRMPSSTGMYSGSQVWSLAVHPTEPGVLLAGTDSGVYRLYQATQCWPHLPSPMDDMLVTALAFSAADLRIILAGTQPA